jgi:hypothetical protein
VESTDDVDERLPLEAQVRLLRSALRIARADCTDASASAASARVQLQELTRVSATAAEERSRLQRALAAAEGSLGKARRAAAGAEVREAEARAEVEALRREVREAAAAAAAAAGGRGGGSGGSGTDGVRLARAQEEVEKLRASLASERAVAGEVAGGHRREMEAVQASLRRAEKQRGGEWGVRAGGGPLQSSAPHALFFYSTTHTPHTHLATPHATPGAELLSAFRKQAKLIEVLKRQRVHMEAARTLEFVERDFLEALGKAGDR